MTDSGLRYCSRHHGIIEVDEAGSCDMAHDDDETLPCRLHALSYDEGRILVER